METIVSLHVCCTGLSGGLSVILLSLWNFLFPSPLQVDSHDSGGQQKYGPFHEVLPDPLNQLAPSACTVPGMELELKD